MNYKIGDTVVHWTYGIGSVVAIEEIHLAGDSRWYYVVQNENLKLWVPVGEEQDCSIRFPLGSAQFTSLLDILSTPGQPLPDNHYQRKLALRDRMQKRTPEGLFRVIRDLKARSRQHTLNTDDSSTLLSAEEHLIDEWVLTLGTERSEAQRELELLLQ